MNPDSERAAIEKPKQSFVAWISGRRIAVSIIGFAITILCNLLLLHSQILDPLNYFQPLSLLGSGLILTGLFIRSWSAGILRKTEVLVTSGPYAVVRNPLYVGSFLMMFGFCLLMNDWPSALFVAGPMAMINRS